MSNISGSAKELNGLAEAGKAQAALGKVLGELSSTLWSPAQPGVNLKYRGLNKFKQTNLPSSLSASGQQRAAHKSGLLFEETAAE